MNIYKQLKILAFFLVASHTFGQGNPRIIATTHPQVASSLRLIKSLYPEDKLLKNWEAKNLYEQVTNIHDFEPSISKLKDLLNHSFLIGGPVTHQKWLIKARDNGLLPQKNLLLTFRDIEDDHFWLSAKAACTFEEQVMKFLKKEDLIEQTGTRYCQWVSDQTLRLKTLFKNSQIKKVILAHSALIPLMKASGLEVLCLRQNDHELEVTPNTLKKAYSWLNDEQRLDKILIINESGYELPNQIKKTDKTIILSWSPITLGAQPIESLFQIISGAL